MLPTYAPNLLLIALWIFFGVVLLFILTCTHPDPYGRIKRKRKTICHMILRSPNLLLSLLASYFYWLAGFVFR